MSHYETLGCGRNATPDELKAAARRAASTAHPDRPGGSNAAMAKVNKARDVLLDPERRAHYDETGEDQAGPSVLDKATQLLVDIFTDALDRDGHIVSFVRDALKDILKNADREKAATAAKIKRLEKRLGKVKVKKGDNLVDMLITGQLNIRIARDHHDTVETAQQALIKLRKSRIERGTWTATSQQLKDIDDALWLYEKVQLANVSNKELEMAKQIVRNVIAGARSGSPGTTTVHVDDIDDSKGAPG